MAHNLQYSQRPHKTKIQLMGLLLAGWYTIPELSPTPPRILPNPDEVKNLIGDFLFPEDVLRANESNESRLAKWGKELFFDTRFSRNQSISCATCHNPDIQFTDSTPVGVGLGKTLRRTPSLVNAFANHWFFWDGRADSLASQALGPTEHPMEHGISRLQVAHLLRDHYKKQYEETFGAFPSDIQKNLPLHAIPRSKLVPIPDQSLSYTLASLEEFSLLDAILKRASNESQSPINILESQAQLTATIPEEWHKNWEALSADTQLSINQVFRHFGEALASYELTIRAINSPFDRFAKNFLKSLTPPFTEEFGKKEFLGLQIFLGPGGCPTCHNGPNFTDQQFHNIGLPYSPLDHAKDFIDLGRAHGVGLVKADIFNGLHFPPQEKTSGSFLELPFLDEENRELVGAFKTPSLRNVGERPPYMHNGSLPTLESVIEHYHSLDAEPFLGHREETLIPLHLSNDEKSALIAFLRSLTSDITSL